MERKSEVRFDTQPSVSNHFAWLRTQLGLQRTLMAAVRTAVSLIGFGFTVAQFFQRMRSNLPEGVRSLREEVPRNLGLVLIAAGVVSLALFTWQYYMANSYLRGEPYKAIAGVGERNMHVATYITAIVVIIIGMAAFISIYVRF